ncbi:MAG: hypothetical protein LBT85_00395 [Bifidobacteriaceae bacterium]|jgi:hypothetical protein|nr:hypothetical protein [Bifidobacteriaceae bacterium]
MKFLKLKKLGIWGIAILLCITCFISGRISIVWADGSISALPISKGGTGANSADEARENLDAQEKLVSNANIKTIFNRSLLGSGNVNSFITATDGTAIKSGQKYIGQVSATTPVDIGTINLKVTNNNLIISFFMQDWNSSYIDYKCANGDTQLLSAFNKYSATYDVVFTIPNECYYTGAIQTGWHRDLFYIQGSIDDYSLGKFVLEKVNADYY